MSGFENTLEVESAASARFKVPFFKNPHIQSEIARQGYSVQPLLNAEDVKQLSSDFFTLLDTMGQPLPDTHWTSGRVEDVKVRNFARLAIENIVPLRLQQYFSTEVVDFIGGIFLAKKPSPISELTAHQDSSHTDENEFPAVYAWIALTDTTEQTGAMHVLPGSHLWGNKYRSLNVPWLYAGFERLMQPYLKPVPMKAGEVLFFDSAAIHYSSNNMGQNIRPAINYFIKPKQALFLHHYINNETAAGKVEVYNVDIDFFYNCDFMQRPPSPPYSRKADEDYNLQKPDEEELLALIKKYLP